MKKILLRLWNFIMKIANKTSEEVKRLIPIATNVVQVVKVVMDNPAFDISAEVLKKLIPGEMDDMIIDRAVFLAKKYIPKIALQLEIINAITENPNADLKVVFAKLQHSSPEKWQKFCSQLAQQVLIDMSDDKITWGEAGVYVELYYRTYIQKQTV